MTKSNLRRIVASASALTMAAGMAATIGMGAANAAPGNVQWTEKVAASKYYLERTISNTTPSPGDTITVATRFYNPPVDWYIKNVKDIHNPCLTYVPGSATFNGENVTSLDVENPAPGYPDIGYVLAKSVPSDRIPLLNKSGKSFEVKYTVGDNCARGIPLQSTVHFDTNLLTRSDANRGPAITVAKTASTTALELTPAPQAGTDTTLTATVAPSTATGEVDFFNGTTKLGTGTLVNGTASYVWKPATAGQDFSITAKYLGDAKNNASNSNAKTGKVAAAPAVKPQAPTVTLSPVSAQVGDTVTATIKTVPNATVAITIDDGAAKEVTANSSGDATYKFQPTQAGTTTVKVTARNSGGTSDATEKTLQVTAAPQGEAIVSINPAAPIAGDTVDISVTGADANTSFTVTQGVANVCATTTNGDGAAACEWKPTEGTYELTIITTVNGEEKTLTKSVTVSAPAVDPGDENPGGETPGDDGNGSLGSLSSLSSIFGSLG